ncbi:DNA cytosine methyltransferase [Mycoplasma hafezii]|uniref:DNA cytosine methyltransferase n=1 Tax=Mycoplasma hafezii TaxID=525886 RepID=UPI003CEA2DDA
MSKHKIIDLFAGAGGLTYGFYHNDFEIVETVEFWQPAVDTYNLNYGTKVTTTDITQEGLVQEIANNWKGIADVVIGGFPCQGYSMAGRRDPHDDRNQLYKYTINLIGLTQPKVFVLENVKGILSFKEHDGVLVTEKILKMLDDYGYYAKFQLVDASKFGVPQKRERVIFIGAPKKDSDKVDQVINMIQNYQVNEQTVFASISDLEDKPENYLPNHIFTKHTSEMIEKLKNTPCGKSPMKNYSDAFRRLYYDRPSYTVKENHGGVHVHPKLNRVLTPRELARLQSFPDDFVFCSTKSNILKQIGNAVPPLLSKRIAKMVKKVFFEDNK